VYISETELDISWMSTVLDTRVLRAEVLPFGEHVGRVAELCKIRVTTHDAVRMFVMKKVAEGDWVSQKMGFSREAFVYSVFEDELKGAVPEAVYAYGDFETGQKILIAEELEGAVNMMSCTPQNPLMNIEEHSAPEGWMESAVSNLARAQAKLWNNPSLLDMNFLGCAAWYRGEQEENFNEGFSGAKALWQGADKSGYSTTVCEIVDAILEKDSLEDWQEAAATRSFTLVHGDFHPGNILHHEGQSKIIDWEMSFVGPGILDLCYLLFNSGNKVRQEKWESLVELYVEELASCGVNYPLEEAK
jgi:hypothetical protein